jgi:hypothetical protein
MITLFSIRPKGFNIGNDAIFLGLEYFLYQAFGEIVNIISLPATSKYETNLLAGLKPKTVHEINQFGDGVIIGGGNLYENGELDVNPTALEALEVPMMLFSLSSGRIYNRRGELVKRTDAMPESTITALHKKAFCSLARDKNTYEYLKSLGCSNVKLGGCPTVFLDRQTNRLPPLSSKNKGTVFVSVRNPSLMNIPLYKQARIYEDITGIIALLRSKGHQDVKLLCHDYRDIAFAASFRDIEYVYPGDVYSYLALLKHCALNVTYRLHSFLPCLSYNVPTVKISYDERATSLIETLGYGEWNINLMEEKSLIEALGARLQGLGSLEAKRAKAKPQWTALEETMTAAMADFAGAVAKYRGRAG